MYPLLVLLEVDDLDRRIELEATQTAGDAVLAYIQANEAWYSAPDALYPGVATIHIDMPDWRVTYGWRTPAAFVQELASATQRAAQVAADLATAVNVSNVPTARAADSGAWKDVRQAQARKAKLVQRGIFCPEVGFLSVPDDGWRVMPTTAAMIDAEPERFALVTLVLAFERASSAVEG